LWRYIKEAAWRITHVADLVIQKTLHWLIEH
jgi:hypothetical protein